MCALGSIGIAIGEYPSIGTGGNFDIGVALGLSLFSNSNFFRFQLLMKKIIDRLILLSHFLILVHERVN